MTEKVAGELYERITGQLFEIGRQLCSCSGYPFNSTKLERHLQDAIDGQFECTVLIRNLPTWKTVKLGTHKSILEVRTSLEVGGYKIGDWASIMSNGITLSPYELEVELVSATVAELGFKGSAYYRDIKSRIQELGFTLCPPEVGPQLRLQYPDQRMGESMFVAMNPIVTVTTKRFLQLFCVEHGVLGKWLDGNDGYDDSLWRPDSRWVFIQRKM